MAQVQVTAAQECLAWLPGQTSSGPIYRNLCLQFRQTDVLRRIPVNTGMLPIKPPARHKKIPLAIATTPHYHCSPVLRWPAQHHLFAAACRAESHQGATVKRVSLTALLLVFGVVACQDASSPTAPASSASPSLRFATNPFHPAAVGAACTPVTSTSEGDLAAGGVGTFAVSSSSGQVTVDPIDAGGGLRSFTVVGAATNATVSIPAFTVGTFAATSVSFTQNNPNQAVDFTLRAASQYHAIFIRVQCACTPILAVTEGDLAPGGPASFTFTAGPGSVTTDPVDAGTGLRALSTTASSNAVVTNPAFASGTTSPVTSTFTIPNAALPASFTLRAANLYHAANVRATCVGNPA